jgi:hypothetical protein
MTVNRDLKSVTNATSPKSGHGERELEPVSNATPATERARAARRHKIDCGRSVEGLMPSGSDRVSVQTLHFTQWTLREAAWASLLPLFQPPEVRQL